MALTDKLTAIANAIRAKTGKTESLTLEQMPTEIESITTGGGEDEKPFDCHSVTFMYGDTVLYVRSVGDGDTCADPVSRNLIQAPTKESDAQYDYTFYGWGASDGGAADANILKNITEDKTVYAIFSKTLRTYTITYYDEDGTTVLKTESLAYGTVPSYAPVKSGYTFSGWKPEATAVTADASYTAAWLEQRDFNSDSWATIASYAEAGNAAEVYALGAEKSFTSGSRSFVARIVGFNHDDLADGSGKAGITLMLIGFIHEMVTLASSANTATYKGKMWPDFNPRKNIANYTAALPSNLCSELKTVTKKYYNHNNSQIATTEDTYFLPSCRELNYSPSTVLSAEGEPYAYFTDTASRIATHNDAAVTYWTRTKTGVTLKAYYVSESGDVLSKSQGSSGVYAFMFVCI